MKDVRDIFDRILDGSQPVLPDGADLVRRAEAVANRRTRMRIATGGVVAVLVLAGAAIAVRTGGDRAMPPTQPGPQTPAASAGSATAPTAAPSPPDGSVQPPVSPAGPPVNPYVRIDSSRIPTGSHGSGERLVRAGGQPGPSTSGEFRTVCAFSHMNFDDPVSAPGRRDATYLHAYFGTTRADANTPAGPIATGTATCRGGVLDRSMYRVPALVDTRTGVPLTPTRLDAFYTNNVYGRDNPSGLRPDQIRAIPAGLRMVAGNERATAPQQRQTGQWGCDDGTNRPYRFWDHVPDYCEAGDAVVLEVNFPQCWNGRDLDSADHRAHLAYPTERGCPSTHPVPLPQLAFVVRYGPVPAGATARDLRLSTDLYPSGSPGGWSWHGAWIDGWDAGTKESWTANCNRAAVNCYSDLIAPGRALYGEL